MGKFRHVVAGAVALAAIGYATVGSGAPDAPKEATPAAATPGQATPPAGAAAPGKTREEVKFRGHRLVVEWDADGKAASAQAYDVKNKPVPTHVTPIADVKVCAPKAIDPGAAPGAAACEPFSFIPEGTSFKTGAHSICWYYRNQQLVYYWCP